VGKRDDDMRGFLAPLATFQRLHDMFEASAGDKNLKTAEKMTSIRSRIISKALSRKVLSVIS
jgi:hypothetical protein